MLRGFFVPGSIRTREEGRWGRVDSFPSGSYNHQILRSQATGDLIAYPDRIWSPNPYWGARTGLGGHLTELADRLGGVVYSDVLIVLHPGDLARSQASLVQSWTDSATAVLADAFATFVESRDLEVAVPGRSFRAEYVADGDPRIGATLGLQRGEFATVLLPNLHLGSGPDEAPLVEVFVADERGRFGSVGTLHTDQLAFTVGAHALDNGRVERLRESALYTLHRLPGESGLRHQVNAEWADRLAVERGSAHGGETIRLHDPARGKDVLELMIIAARPLEQELPYRGEAQRGPLNLGSLPGFSPVAPTGPTILPEALVLGEVGALSIIPEALPQRVHTLSQRRFLLQRVHFRKEMHGYRVDLDRSGNVGPELPDPVARFEVQGERITLHAVGRDVSVDGMPMRAGESRLLSGAHEVQWRQGELSVEPMTRDDRKRWPYLASLTLPHRNTPLPEGGDWSIGRDADTCDVVLPDRPTSQNILWRDGRTEGPIVVRGGQVDRLHFRTDAICVASRAAAVDLSAFQPVLRNLSDTCVLHVLRGRQALPVPRGGELALEAGDELLVGNHGFRLIAPGESEVVAAAVAVEGSERLEEGPGTRGRRPRAGGAAGALVEEERTYGALLGISPAAERGEVTQIGPGTPSVPGIPGPAARPELEPAPAASLRPPTRTQTSAAAVRPDAVGETQAGVAAVDPDATRPGLPQVSIPTEHLPSLSLDPSVQEEEAWLLGDQEIPCLDVAMTVMGDDGDGAAAAADWLAGGELEVPLDFAPTVVDDALAWLGPAASAVMAQPAVEVDAPGVSAPLLSALPSVETEPLLASLPSIHDEPVVRRSPRGLHIPSARTGPPPRLRRSRALPGLGFRRSISRSGE